MTFLGLRVRPWIESRRSRSTHLPCVGHEWASSIGDRGRVGKHATLASASR